MKKYDCIFRAGIHCMKTGYFCGEYPGTGLDMCDTAHEVEEISLPEDEISFEDFDYDDGEVAEENYDICPDW